MKLEEVRCDVCGKNINNNSYYYTVTTRHSDCNNNSYENTDNVCSDHCLTKKFNDFIKCKDVIKSVEAVQSMLFLEK